MKNEIESEEIFSPVQKELEKRLGASIDDSNYDTLASVVVKKLIQKRQTLSLAESCTGGLIGKLITDIPGSSQVFMQGLIVYSNEAKQQLLQVNEATLKQYGAVSKETATEMVNGLHKSAGTDIALSITGIAGPGGGTETKPVGLVYVGIKTKQIVKTYQLNLKGNRDKVRQQAAQHALNIIQLHIQKSNICS